MSHWGGVVPALLPIQLVWNPKMLGSSYSLQLLIQQVDHEYYEEGWLVSKLVGLKLT